MTTVDFVNLTYVHFGVLKINTTLPWDLNIAHLLTKNYTKPYSVIHFQKQLTNCRGGGSGGSPHPPLYSLDSSGETEGT